MTMTRKLRCLQFPVTGNLNSSPSIYRSCYSPAPSFSTSSPLKLNAGVSASASASASASDLTSLAEASPMMKSLMLRKGLRLPVTGKLNSSLSNYRILSSPAPFFSTSSPLNTEFYASASSMFSSSATPVNAGGFASASAAAAELAVGDSLIDDDTIAKAYKTNAAPKVLQPGVIVYDGVCHLCHNGVKWVIKADKYRNLKFCCLQSKAAEPYMDLCGVDRDDVRRRFIFIEGYGLYHQGSTAALRVLANLPFPYSALSSLMIVPAPLRDAIYDHVAKKRYNWFGKSDDCLVLREQELLARFIDREELLERNQRVL